MITEICGMIRNAQNNDSAGVLNYARLLAENLDKAGQHTEATRVRRALGEHTIQSPPVEMDSSIAITGSGMPNP